MAPFTEKIGVYAFGIILQEILDRRSPQLNRNSNQEPSKYFRQSFADIHCFSTSLGEGYAELVRQCLDENPQRRPTFNEIVQAVSVIDLYSISLIIKVEHDQ